MELLHLPRYDRLGASSRLRLYQYRPWLEAAGVRCGNSPFFDAAYLADLYGGRSTRGATLRAFARRLRALRAAGGSDLLWVEKEALPFLPWAMERALLPRGVPMVSDYDDAVFHRYDMHGRKIVRSLLGNKIGSVMAASTMVFAGNAYLADHARAAGARRIEIVPTVVDADAYRLRSEAGEGMPPRVGWIGSPTSWSEFGRPLIDLVLETLKPSGGLFRVVGGGPQTAGVPGVEALEWSEETEVELIRGMDVGVMPLTDTPWARGKCGYKLIQYMACGVPVIASPVGVNAEIVTHGETGFLATTPEEWREALSILLSDPDLRRRMGAAGRARVEQDYSLQVWGPRVADLLKEAAGVIAYLVPFLGLSALRAGLTPRQRLQLYWLVLFGLFLFVGFRFWVGCDWRGYLHQYGVAGSSDFLWSEMPEPFWWFMMQKLRELDLRYEWINVISAVFFFVGIHVLARRQPDPLSFLILLFPILIMNIGMSALRQAVATGFVVAAFQAFVDRRLILFVALLLLGGQFHSSAMVFLLLAPLVNGGYSKRRLILAVVLAVPGALALVSGSAGDLAISRYIDSGIDAGGAVFRVGFLGLSGLGFLLLVRRYWEGVYPQDFKLVMIGALLMVLSLLLLPLSSVIADRLAYYLVPIQVVIFARLPFLPFPAANRDLIVALPWIGITTVFTAWMTLSGLFQACYTPYRSWLF